MRSKRAFIGAGLIVLSYPIALAAQFLLGSGAVTVIHFITGTGFIVFATSVFDFGLPRWVSVIGAAAAAAFGTIFILQGVSDVTQLGVLHFVAYDVLGRHMERFLPYVVYFWFIALLLLKSAGKSRVLGWVVMLIVVGVEIATLASLVFAFGMPNLKVVLLLPFGWLLFESADRDRRDRAPGNRGGSRARVR